MVDFPASCRLVWPASTSANSSGIRSKASRPESEYPRGELMQTNQHVVVGAQPPPGKCLCKVIVNHLNHLPNMTGICGFGGIRLRPLTSANIRAHLDGPQHLLRLTARHQFIPNYQLQRWLQEICMVASETDY